MIMSGRFTIADDKTWASGAIRGQTAKRVRTSCSLAVCLASHA